MKSDLSEDIIACMVVGGLIIAALLWVKSADSPEPKKPAMPVQDAPFTATLDTLKELSLPGTAPLLIVTDNTWMTLTFGPEGPSTAKGAVMTLKVEPIVERLGTTWRVTFKVP